MAKTAAAWKTATTPAATRLPSPWSIWPTMAVTWTAFAHVLSFQGLAIWVIGGSCLTALVVLPVSLAHRRFLAVAGMVVMTFTVPLLANWLGGEAAGPVARSALMASSVTAAMCVILPSRYPMAMLVPALLLLGAVLGLGASTTALWLVGPWTVAAAVTIAALGPFRNTDLRDRARLVPFAAMLAATGLFSVLAMAVSAPLAGQPWMIPGSGGTTTTATATATQRTTPTSSTPSPMAQTPHTSPRTQDTDIPLILWILQALLSLVTLTLLVLLTRRVIIATQWLVLRRRLSAGDTERRAIGAWTWVRLRRARYDRQLPLNVTPDVAVKWAGATGDPDMQLVASVASKVAYAPSATVTQAQSAEAWRAARLAGRRPRPAGLRRRWAWAGRSVRSTQRNLDRSP